MSKPEIETVRQLDILGALRHFIGKGIITGDDKRIFVDKYLNFPGNGSVVGFFPLEAEADLEGDYFPEGVKRVIRLLIKEYGKEEYDFKVSW